MQFVIALIVVVIGTGVYFITSYSNNQNTATSPRGQEIVVDPNNNGVNESPYADGTYSGTNVYNTPAGDHTLTVNLTLQNGMVVAAETVHDDLAGLSTETAARFDSLYSTEVIGKQLDEVSLSRVGGASLTSVAFNNAVAEIKTAAQI